MLVCGGKGKAVLGGGQKLCRLLIEVFATPATICDKTLTIRQNRVAKLLCLQHPIPSQSLESDGVDEIIEDAGKYLKMHKETIEKIIEKWESMYRPLFELSQNLRQLDSLNLPCFDHQNDSFCKPVTSFGVVFLLQRSTEAPGKHLPETCPDRTHKGLDHIVG